MAEYSREDAEYAANIVLRLTNREAEGLELGPDVVVSDVESDANAFSDDLSLLQDFNADMPAVRIAGEKVPVSLGLAIGGSDRGSLFPPFGYSFVRRATEFVATRIAAVRGFRNRGPDAAWPRPSLLTLRQLLRGRQVETPGCHFTVSSNSSGLRVFWSGAYYVTPNNFNHPTSPTSSVLQSGTYIFGVDGGAYGNNIQWDLNCIVSLPGLPYAHLNF